MRTDRIVLTVTQETTEAPPPQLAEAVAALLSSVLRVSGFEGPTVTGEVNPEDPRCAECGDDVSAHEWHYDMTHTYEPEAAS